MPHQRVLESAKDQVLGPPVVLFYACLGEGSTKIDYRKRVSLFRYDISLLNFGALPLPTIAFVTRFRHLRSLRLGQVGPPKKSCFLRGAACQSGSYMASVFLKQTPPKMVGFPFRFPSKRPSKGVPERSASRPYCDSVFLGVYSPDRWMSLTWA